MVRGSVARHCTPSSVCFMPSIEPYHQCNEPCLRSCRLCSVHKMKDSFLGVPIIRIIVFGGPYLGSPYFGKLQNSPVQKSPKSRRLRLWHKISPKTSSSQKNLNEFQLKASRFPKSALQDLLGFRAWAQTSQHLRPIPLIIKALSIIKTKYSCQELK